MTEHIFRFGGGLAEGCGVGPERLGGKGAMLAEIARLGLPTPPGFTIDAALCARWRAAGGRIPDADWAAIRAAVGWIERTAGRGFGDPARPLLLSARSGAAVSMPGAMDSLLNLGLTAAAAAGLADESGDLGFAMDCRRRLIAGFADIVMGLDADALEDALDDARAVHDVEDNAGLNAEDWRRAFDDFLATLAEDAGEPFPDDADIQLRRAIEAVLKSWDNPRARRMRALHRVEEGFGSAVTVQAMAFGNRDARSATGVLFTRDPSTGAAGLFGEYLPSAQGEDVVAGLRTPRPLTKAGRETSRGRALSLEETAPEAFAQLAGFAEQLERHFGDMQDIEFTIESGKVWLLQTRAGKRSARAAIRIAVDLEAGGALTREAALMKIDPRSLENLLHPTVDPAAARAVFARGLPASPGAAAGELVFTPEQAQAASTHGRQAILARVETSPEDIHGMYAAAAVITQRGGMTSHAAVVARGLGKPCVCGASDIVVDVANERLVLANGEILERGAIVTIDGGSGEGLRGAAPMVEPELDDAFALLMGWADAARRLEVRANADTPKEAEIARRLGATGIGLCRTEHGFFEQGRIVAMREMILASDAGGRRAALNKLLPMQREDFRRLFETMQGAPVTIRLIDPPLHEFLPHSDAEIQDVASAMGIPARAIRDRVRELAEFNPMLGRRGCRIGIAFPEVYEMQVRAIIEAAAEAGRVTGQPATPEIMIPFVSTYREVEILRAVVDQAAAQAQEATGAQIAYRVGVMIETPRAALRAESLCEAASFMSFGTNDLTQLVYGLSRDDAGKFMRDYVARGAAPADPFHVFDEEGVGELIRIAVERGRKARPDVGLGLCGEHGGSPDAIDFCERVGIDYVSCSPFRTPVARLAAAQAAIRKRLAAL